ncbi:F-box/FBD/LRR-repeat protein At1g13570 [Linum perenne]
MATAAGGSGGIDRISSLPDNAREHILHFLPLRDAAKASLLSTTWGNMWMHLPTLVLDDKSFFQLATIDKLMFNICRVLLLHRGPLRELTLLIPNLGSFPDQLYQILMFLQDKRLESLTVVDHIERYNLPSCLFSPSFSRHLKTLRLSGCQFPASSPVSFEGFSMLTVLELRNMNMIGEASLTTLWSFRCHSLSTLILDGFGGYSQRHPILIEAPRLEYFHFVGNFCYLHMSTPCLKHAIIHKGTTFLVDRKPDSILKTWYGLEAIEYVAARDKWGLLRHLRPWEMLRHMTFNDMCLSTIRLSI